MSTNPFEPPKEVNEPLKRPSRWPLALAIAALSVMLFFACGGGCCFFSYKVDQFAPGEQERLIEEARRMEEAMKAEEDRQKLGSDDVPHN